MTEIYDDKYWENEFDITKNDLDRIAKRIKKKQTGYTLTNLVNRIVRGRLKHGRDTGPVALPDWVKEQEVRSWDEIDSWQVGERVLVARSSERRSIKPYFGIIREATPTLFHVWLEELDMVVRYNRVEKGSRDGQIYYENVLRAIWQREKKSQKQGKRTNIEDHVEVILLSHGSRIASRLLNALDSDSRFVMYFDQWFLRELLIPIDQSKIEQIHRRMSIDNRPYTIEEVLTITPLNLPDGDIGLFSIYQTLCENQELFKFEDEEWRAVKPPPIPWQQAKGLNYVYDPETFRIIVQPDQQITKSVAERLWELGWYEIVVTRR